MENRVENSRTASLALNLENPTRVKDSIKRIELDMADKFDLPQKSLSVSVLNEVRQEYLRQAQIAGIGKFDRIALHLEPGEPLAFEIPNTLRINPRELQQAFTNPALFFKENVESFEKNGNQRFLAIDNMKNVKKHMIAHEVGHKVFYLSKLADKYDKLRELYELSVKDGTISNIGMYALQSAKMGDFQEFFAEIYAMWTRKDVSLPKRMSDFVLEVLE